MAIFLHVCQSHTQVHFLLPARGKEPRYEAMCMHGQTMNQLVFTVSCHASFCPDPVVLIQGEVSCMESLVTATTAG